MAFLNKAQTGSIAKAIAKAELNTSGEIRVHIESKHKEATAMARAITVFERLKMTQTKAKNGVLIYIAFGMKKFAIYGDEGIHNIVGQSFWDQEITLLETHFKKGEFTKGICLAIDQIGQKLKQHFPYQSDDKNELSNEVSFGD